MKATNVLLFQGRGELGEEKLVYKSYYMFIILFALYPLGTHSASVPMSNYSIKKYIYIGLRT